MQMIGIKSPIDNIMYGFIQKDSDKKDIFIHYSAITMDGYKTLKTNDIVSFDVTQGEKGPQAANVVLVSSAPEGDTK
jgi:CspA family cold shock protein